MHECYVMQLLEIKGKTQKPNNKEKWSQKGKAMKHKDHVRKTQLDRAFCIQNLLDAPRVLEFEFTLE